MKKLILLFVFFFTILMFGKAQNYIPMVKDDVQYNYYDTYAGPPPYYSKLYTFSKDTLINSNHYKRLDVSLDSTNWLSTPYFFHEDTLEERVYLFYNDTVGLLYDFSLSVGDTANVYNPAFGTYSHQLIVNSVDSILLSGKYHKIVEFSSNYWIEGIGDIYGIMAPGREQIGVSETLVCYHLQDILLYINNLYSSCFFNSLGINDSGIEDYVRAFPNPTSNSFNVAYDFANVEDGEFVLYSLEGKTLIQKNLPNTQNQITLNTTSLNNGIYFYTVYNKGSFVANGKLVILK